METIHFTDSARLYAEHAEVVELMQSQFVQSVSAFLSAIKDAMEPMVAPERLWEKQTAKQATASYRYWWLADEGKDMESHPLLWFQQTQPSIVQPGRLRTIACAPKASKDARSHYLALPKSPEWGSYCSTYNGGQWSLFYFTVEYKDGDLIERVAEPISRMLLALRETERIIQEAQQAG